MDPFIGWSAVALPVVLLGLIWAGFLSVQTVLYPLEQAMRLDYIVRGQGMKKLYNQQCGEKICLNAFK